MRGLRTVYPASRKVVVGEADAIVLALIDYLLTREGYAVDCVADREELLQRIRAGDYDVIVADAHLDGVLDAVRSCPPERASRVILTSPLDVESAGFATLRKPLELGLLVETVRDCVNRPD